MPAVARSAAPIRSIDAPQNPTAENEKRLQGKDSPQPRTVVVATDGSGQALQFDRKRMRLIHIDSNGTITPEREWRPVDLRRILKWVERTTPSGTRQPVAGFTRIGAAL